MSLDSTDSLSTAKGENDIGQVGTTHLKEEEYPEQSSWCYLFMHRTKVRHFIEATLPYFNCYVHETVYKYARSKKDMGEVQAPTISGLVFLQGVAEDIKSYLSDKFPGLHLARDYSNKRTAVIPDRVMRPFMRLAESDPTRIRVLHHPLDYYSKGRSLVRFTSGIFSGCEGYIVRIDRDRKLVMQIGNMTVAIGGIHKEHFENLDEFPEWKCEKR